MQQFCPRIADGKEYESGLMFNDDLHLDPLKVLYTVSYERVAPAFIHAADLFLKRAIPRTSVESHLYFLARDGFGPFTIAQHLLAKFPDRYPGLKADCLHYFYLNTDTLSSTLTLKYLKQRGLEPKQQAHYYDLGWFGYLNLTLSRLVQSLGAKYQGMNLIFSPLPPNQAVRCVFGFQILDPPFEWVTGKRAVHFLEDTFSGTDRRAKQLFQDSFGKVMPVIPKEKYDRSCLEKRRCAHDGLVDAVKTVTSEAVLNSYGTSTCLKLLFPLLHELNKEQSPFHSIMMPHESN